MSTASQSVSVGVSSVRDSELCGAVFLGSSL